MEDRFFFWRNYWDALSKLDTDEDRGRFVRAMCEYAFDGTDPDFGDNRTLDVAWTMIRSQVRESVMLGRRASDSGKTGGRGNRKRGAKRVPLSTPSSTPERVPESVRYGNTSLTGGTEDGTARVEEIMVDDMPPADYA